MRRTANALFVAALLTGCGDQRATVETEGGRPARPAGDVEGGDAPAGSLVVSTSYEGALAGEHLASVTVGEFDDLVFHAPIAGRDGDAAVLELHAPGGGVLTRYHTSITSGRAIFVVPFSGTSLERAGVAGVHEVVVHVGGERAAEVAFEIRPAAPPPSSPAPSTPHSEAFSL